MKAWLFDAVAWWLTTLGGAARYRDTATVVTPTLDDFPVDPELEGEELAEDYFAFVLEHARLRDEWDFEPEAEFTPNVADALRGMPHAMTEAPTRSGDEDWLPAGDPLPIPYDPSALERPALLVATFARGIAHYLAQSDPDLPTGEAHRERLVDLGAVVLGFGIFLANTAFEFQQTSSGGMTGWGYDHRGALGQVEVAYALAIVATLLDFPDREVRAHLGPNPKAFYAAARKDLDRHRGTDLAVLRAAPSSGHGPYR